MRLIDIDELKKRFGDRRLDWCICDNKTTARDLIDESPIIESEPVRHGKWVAKTYEPGEIINCCSCCRYPISDFLREIYHYCPNCGAKMDLSK